MEENQAVMDPAVSEQSEERRTDEAPTTIVARLLANPRRVRRD